MKKEKLIKSKERVKKFAEVFTPEHIVKDMCDLIPSDQWTIESTFLEPACGNGNFLAEIFKRKLELCKNEKDGLKALASIYGIDIQADNVAESRARLVEMYLDKFPNANGFAFLSAWCIVYDHIICGDSLEIMRRLETK